MAASMEKCARVKLLFKHGEIEPSWLLIRTNKLPCIVDIHNVIRNRFDLLSREIKLYLSGCILPSWESTELLHDNDVIDVFIVEKNVLPGVCFPSAEGVHAKSATEIAQHRKKKKKHKPNHDGDFGENGNSELVENVDEETENKNISEIVQQKRKKRKHKTKDKRNEEDDSGKLMDNTTNSSECNNKTSNQICGFQNSDDVLSEKMPKHKKRRTEVMEVMDSMMHDQTSSHFARVNPDLFSNAVKIVSCKSVKCPTDSPCAGDLDRTRSSSVNTSVVSDLQASQVSAVNTSIDPTAEQSKAKKKRIRKRKKKNPAVSQESPSVPPNDQPAETAKLNSEWPVKVNVKLNLPRSKRPKNKRFTFDDSAGSDNEEDDVSGAWRIKENIKNQELQSFPSTDGQITGNGISSVSDTYNRVEFSYENSVKPVNTYSRQNHEESPHTSLPNTVKVYTRQNLMPKRNSGQFREMSKGEQLATVATNKSVILKNPSVKETYAAVCGEMDGAVCDETEVAGYEEMEAAGYEDAGEQEAEEAEEIKIVPAVVKDYTGFPALHGPPRTGDTIAFKVLELSENYEPGLSDFKEAEVLNYDPVTTMVSLKILNKSNIPKIRGKFDITNDDEDEADISDNEENHQWASLVEPKLL